MQVAVEGLRFGYPDEGFVLDVPGFTVPSGRCVAWTGPSGCGKTTLLRLVAGLLVPDHGSVSLDGRAIQAWSEARRRELRIRDIGLVFQDFALLEYLDLRDNVLLPYRLHGCLRLDAAAAERADALLERLGLADKRHRRPEALSQGERQRLAVCRALVTGPRLVLADEPTGNLDPDNREKVLGLLVEEVRRHGATLVVVTHDQTRVDRFDEVRDVESLRRRPEAAGRTG
ncbi:MAG: ATP-binding cassette domain-containing protein [Planctomycetota bacterium]